MKEWIKSCISEKNWKDNIKWCFININVFCDKDESD